MVHSHNTPVPPTPHSQAVPLDPPRRGGRSSSPVERLLIERLGGAPWLCRDSSGTTLGSAQSRWAALRSLLGYDDTSTARWMTDDSAKLNKTLGQGGVQSALGVTLLAAHGARDVWASLSAAEQSQWCEALGVPPSTVAAIVAHTVCECSTCACRDGCVTSKSRNSQNGTTPLTRLARTLLTLVHPAESLELTHAALRQVRDRYGADGVRWRMNLADDIRWELIAPGLLGLVPAYAYTKHSPVNRPEIPGQTRIVYSASEYWSVERIVETCAAGHTVAVVFDVGRNGRLPTSWHGVKVVDGDITDDLWTHPYGVIVGLSPKGPDNATIARLVASGFARPVDPA